VFGKAGKLMMTISGIAQGARNGLPYAQHRPSINQQSDNIYALILITRPDDPTSLLYDARRLPGGQLRWHV
jgi:hypothetical protein